MLRGEKFQAQYDPLQLNTKEYYVNQNDIRSTQLVFPDLVEHYSKFPDHSRLSLTFGKNGIFSKSSRLSRFSMRPVLAFGSGEYRGQRELFLHKMPNAENKN